MKSHITILALLILLAGCVSTPRREAPPVIEPLRKADTAELQKRTAEFRQLISGLKLRGAGCFVSAVVKSNIPIDKVMTGVAALGFNRIYAFITSETELDGEFQRFLAAAAEKSLPVEVVLCQRDFFNRSRGNKVLRRILPRHPELPQAAEMVAEFNRELPPEHRIAGITVVLQPHCFDHAMTAAPHEQIYAWSDESYGIGGDNDLLMRNAFDLLKELPRKTGGLPLTVAIQDFFHDKATEGKLSMGTIKDFAAAIVPAPRLLINNSGNRPTQLVDAVSRELAAAPAGTEIAVVINLANHTSVNAGALRRRDWNDMLRSLRYMLEKTSSEPAFSGVVIGPLAALEFLRAEKD